MTTYEVATPTDDATLRALLRENTMASWVTVSLEREPSYFAGLDSLGREWAVIARRGSVPVGMYSCTEQQVHLNGLPVELGYLGSLRVSPGFRNNLRVLRDGFESIRRFRHASGPALWFTAIAAENRTARRVLEANLKGMPRYDFQNELVTLVLPKARERRVGFWRPVAPEEWPSVCTFHNEHARNFNFSPCLAVDSAARTTASFYVAERQGRRIASMALWNQQPHRQVVVRGYRNPLQLLRPLYNVYARATKRVVLPRVGEALDRSSLAFLAVTDSEELNMEELIADALFLCPTTLMTFGLHSQSPWLAELQIKFRPETYRTRIYTVSFDGDPAVDARPAQPDVALL